MQSDWLELILSAERTNRPDSLPITRIHIERLQFRLSNAMQTPQDKTTGIIIRISNYLFWWKRSAAIGDNWSTSVAPISEILELRERRLDNDHEWVAERSLVNSRTFERAGAPRLWMSAWRVARRPSKRKRIRPERKKNLLIYFRIKRNKKTLIISNMSRDYWDLKSCWSIRRPCHPLDQFVTWLLEHEVIVSGGPPHVQVVARFVHALLNGRMKRKCVMRGGLVSLQIRKRLDTKKLDGCKKVNLVFRLKKHSV